MDKSGMASSIVSMTASAMSVVEESAGEAAAEPKKEEALSHILRNPCRVLPSQARFVGFASDSRYKPVVQGIVHGIIVVADLRPSEEAQVLSPSIVIAPVILTRLQVCCPHHRAARRRCRRERAGTAAGARPSGAGIKGLKGCRAWGSTTLCFAPIVVSLVAAAVRVLGISCCCK